MTAKRYVELGFACLDIDRQRRRGFPEVVFCRHKTKDEIIRICQELIKKEAPLLLTRLDSSLYPVLRKKFKGLRFNKRAGLAYRAGKQRQDAVKGYCLVVTAGTSDI